MRFVKEQSQVRRITVMTKLTKNSIFVKAQHKNPQAKMAARKVLVSSAAAGGALAGGSWAFPHFEDWYWLRNDPNRVSERVPDSGAGKLAQTQRGGDDAAEDKKRLVILGSGWASVSALRNIDRDKYEVTVVSPRNYFLFTPLLPSVSVGTISNDAVTIPMREFTSYKTLPMTKRIEFLWRGYLPPRCQYIYASASDIDPFKKVVTCQQPNDESQTFPLEYDELVICTGATTNTFNTQGVDKYCHFLKQTGDATQIRQAVLHNLERASLPHVTEEEQKKLLSFLVVGGGPTGVEFAAELQDFLVHDVVNPKHSRYHRLNGMTSVTLVQSNKNLLPGYPSKIQEFSEDHMGSSGIILMTESRVKAVNDHSVDVLKKSTNELLSLPYGVVVWATGVSPGKFVKGLLEKIPTGYQSSYRSLQTDKHCRVLGLENIWAIGDCADIDVHAEYRAHAIKLWEAFPKITIKGEERLTMKSNMTFLEELRRKFEAGEIVALNDGSGKLLGKVIEDLEKQHADASKNPKKYLGLSQKDLTDTVQKHFERQKYLPATAQVANQQGAWLASILNDPKIDENGKWTFDHTPPFDFNSLGQLVYVGGHMAAMSIPATKDYDVTWNGSLTNYIWHAAYFGMNESNSSRYELLVDWAKTAIFGRSTALSSIVTNDSRARTAVLTESHIKKPEKSGWFW